MKIIVKNLSKKYKNSNQKALDNISFELPETGLIFICGDNGSGKTTLINCLSLNDLDFDGDIFYDSKSSKEMLEDEKNSIMYNDISIIYQKNNLIDSLNVDKNTRISSLLFNTPEENVKLFSVENKKSVKELSGGQQQKVAINRALIQSKKILILDEPTSSLDYSSTIEIMENMKEVSKDRLVICITHNLELLEKYADRIIKLSNGVIVEDKVINENDNKCSIPTAKIGKIRKSNLLKFSFLYYKSNFIQSFLLIILSIFFLLSSFIFIQALTFDNKKAINKEIQSDYVFLYKDYRAKYDNINFLYSNYKDDNLIKDTHGKLSYYIDKYDGIVINDKYDKCLIGRETLYKYFDKLKLESDLDIEVTYKTYKLNITVTDTFDGYGIRCSKNILDNISNDTIIVENGIWIGNWFINSYNDENRNNSLHLKSVEYVPISYYNEISNSNITLNDNEVIISSELFGYLDDSDIYKFLDYNKFDNKKIQGNFINLNDIFINGIKPIALEDELAFTTYDFIVVNDEYYNKIVEQSNIIDFYVVDKNSDIADLVLNHNYNISTVDYTKFDDQVLLKVVNYALEVKNIHAGLLAVALICLILFVVSTILAYSLIIKSDKVKHGIYLSLGLGKRNTRISSYLSLLPYVIVSFIISIICVLLVDTPLNQKTLGSMIYEYGYKVFSFNTVNIILIIVILILTLFVNYLMYYLKVRKCQIKDYFN